ncbi:MAG: hypothetical protein AAF921_25710 [Cyanobacteria bacterium P01_D01_bin.44]
MKYSIELTSELSSNSYLQAGKSALALSLHGMTGCSMQACLRMSAAVGVSAFIGSVLIGSRTFGSRTFGLIRFGLARWFDGIHVWMFLSANRPASLPTGMLSAAFANGGCDYLNRLEPKSYTRSGERSYWAAIPM